MVTMVAVFKGTLVRQDGHKWHCYYLQTLSNLSESNCSQSESDCSCFETGLLPTRRPVHSRFREFHAQSLANKLVAITSNYSHKEVAALVSSRLLQFLVEQYWNSKKCDSNRKREIFVLKVKSSLFPVSITLVQISLPLGGCLQKAGISHAKCGWHWQAASGQSNCEDVANVAIYLFVPCKCQQPPESAHQSSWGIHKFPKQLARACVMCQAKSFECQQVAFIISSQTVGRVSWSQMVFWGSRKEERTCISTHF